MNYSVNNSSIINNSTTKKHDTDVEDSNFFTLFTEYIRNNHNTFVLVFYILLVIFILELALIYYLQKKKITIWQLCSDNCFKKRLKRKKNLVIQMGNLSHSIDIK